MPICACSSSISLYYEVHGDGAPLLLISGLGGGSWSWYGQIPFFSPRYRTIVFDNRGAGKSSVPRGPYTIAGMAQDTLDLLDHLQADQALVAGLSMGGMIAQELALLAPERIRALVLGCTHCGGALHVSASGNVLQAFLQNDGLSREEILRKNASLFFSEAFRLTRLKAIDRYIQVQLTSPIRPPHAFEAQVEAIRTFDRCSRLHRIAAPTLVITGTEDALIPAANARILANRIPHARLHEIPGAGHALHVECRDELNFLMDDFFQETMKGAER